MSLLEFKDDWVMCFVNILIHQYSDFIRVTFTKYYCNHGNFQHNFLLAFPCNTGRNFTTLRRPQDPLPIFRCWKTHLGGEQVGADALACVG